MGSTKEPTNFLIYIACCCSASNLTFHAFTFHSRYTKPPSSRNCKQHRMWELGTHDRWNKHAKPSYDGKIISFVEVESLCGATGYPLRTPRLEDTVLDAHTREPITVITERYLDVLRFGRWSQPGHNQKLAQFISEIRVERSHSMFCTNCHKIDITTGYCS